MVRKKMDLTQVKLSKTEWQTIEIPVSPKEKQILELICQGYHQPNIQLNSNLSLIGYLKIEKTPENEIALYKRYFENDIQTMLKNNKDLSHHSDSFTYLKKEKKDKKTNKADQIRIQNMEKNIDHNKEQIFEFRLTEFSKKIIECLPNNEHGFYLYSLIQFKKSSIFGINPYVQRFVDIIIEYANRVTSMKDIIHSAQYFIEKNKYLIQYEDMTLFSHQKELFSIFNSNADNRNQGKLVLYIAPTGTGKTLSPIGLSEGYKIIFVCVARHIGLSLGKSAISLGKKIAFALGCDTDNNIRLHDLAESADSKNRRFIKGKIRGKIDNSDGSKVEIMICDVKSYLIAMRYMLLFNNETDIITYWDEPTITMDYPEHELHETIHQNWIQNKISKVVLSCATLPSAEELRATIADFKQRFTVTEEESTIEPLIYPITSYDCKKSISLINKEGCCVLPHFIFREYRDIVKCVDHCRKNKTLLRYFDLGEITRFIEYVIGGDNILLDKSLTIEGRFSVISDITMLSLKLYYLDLLLGINPERWTELYEVFTNNQKQKFAELVKPKSNLRKIKSMDYSRQGQTRSEPFALRRTTSVDQSTTQQQQSQQSQDQSNGILLTTRDAHTLTDGPTIFIVEDIEKVGRFYIQQSKIPERVFLSIMEKIERNNIIQEKITRLEKEMEDYLGKDAQKEKKMSKSDDDVDDDENRKSNTEYKRMKSELTEYQSNIQSIQMNDVYIPNCKEHQQKWLPNDSLPVENAFVPMLEEENIRKIMMLEIDTQMKVLLLLGIGVFVNRPNVAYMEIMKSLAYDQKLYLIIASSDYIYGTNYQFCHGLLGKDLENMTQQKTIQAMGRIGRGNIQQDYTVRFRENAMLARLFRPIDPEQNLEAINMSNLFCS